jgi:hypothetical protein
MSIEICNKRGVARQGVIAVLIAAALSLVSTVTASAQSWQPILSTSLGPSKPGTPLLLTDGSVLVQDEGTSVWYKLTPDIHGDYARGFWRPFTSLPAGYAPTFFASAVLADGRVLVMGGEYNFGVFAMTNKGAILDPTTGLWTRVDSPPGWPNLIGDAQCTVLPDGRLMLADPGFALSAILDPVTLSWTASRFNDVGKVDRNDEEGWTLLPDGSILTVDAIANPHTERFVPSLGRWISAGNTPVTLPDPASQEIGPAVLRPDGTVFATGAAGRTAIYTPGAGLTDTGTWTAGPDFPICVGTNCAGQQLGIADGPAALLPNGNVLMGASPKFSFPTQFFEFDGTHLNPVPSMPGAEAFGTWVTRMLILPSGQVLYTVASSSAPFSGFAPQAQIYTPAGGPQDSWRPAISHAPAAVDPGQTFFVSGTQFNGLSQGSAYGDDVTNATNYPLARITNTSTGHVFYARTSTHSTMAVATGPASVFTNVTVPLSIEAGPSTIEVVANGIASFPMPIFVGGGNTTPEVRSVTPNLVSDPFTGALGFILTVNGLKFQPGDTLIWMAGSQTSLTTTVASGSQITAELPASLAADTGTVFLQVARADGTVSNAINFTVPIIERLVSVHGGNVSDAGAAGFTLGVNGARFRSGDIVTWTFGGVRIPLVTTFVSAGQVTASVTAAMLLEPGIASITVGQGIGQSNAVPYFIFAPSPSLTAINPNPVSAGTPSFTLTLTGTWFDPTSTAVWQPVPAGTAIPLATTYVSRTRLTATVPASLVTTAGAADVWVDTPDADPTMTITFLITPPLDLESITPTTATAETPFTMVLAGANFIDGAQVSLNGALVKATVLSPAQMVANTPVSLAGIYSVRIVNPGGAISEDAKTLTVLNPVPQISSLSPGTVPVISPTFTLTINGANFVTTSVARWNGAALPTTYVSPTELQATISSTFLTKKDNFTITILNLSPGGGGSNGVNLTAN